jgi:hypothetical protein
VSEPSSNQQIALRTLPDLEGGNRSCRPQHLPKALSSLRSDDGSGRIYEQGSCSLKKQDLAPGQQPAFFAQGPVVPWSSGYLTS